MTRINVAILVLIATVTGCRVEPRPEPAAEPRDTREALLELRRAYQTIDARVVVGLVAAALPEHQLVAVEDVPLELFRRGDVMMFIDADQQVLGSGHVVRVTETMLHLRYRPEDVRLREPQRGDFAVRTRVPAVRP